MLGTSNLGKSFGDRALFEGVSLKLNPGSRYGLVGANGSGKTTFLKILAGDEPATEGAVSLPKDARVGVLRQDHFLRDDEIILDLTMMGDRIVWEALCQRDGRAPSSAGGADGLSPGESALSAADLEDRIRAHDGYTLEARASAVLEGLGIPVEAHRRPLSTLSGGFKLRVLLAQVLMGGSDVLLLDEPTNHLDILSIRWLERFLAGYKGTAIVISHDQRFLDNVASHILDVDYGTITLYTGNYAAFVAEKRAVRERKEGEIERAEQEIAHKRAFVERFRYKATKARQAQSRLKQIEKIEVEELADTSRRAPTFRIVAARPSGRDVLEARSISKAYGARQVLRDVSLSVRRGEKVAVIGPNGLGKSTLLKILVDRLSSDAGEVAWGHEVQIGYFAQDHREILHGTPEGGARSPSQQGGAETPLSFIWAACPDESPSYVRGQLGRMLFSGDDVEKPVGALSGGEAARLIFCRIIVERPNVLVLDEPTNHLDIEAISALVDGLKAFEGTVIFVSHDRFFVSELATRVLEITPDGPRDFPGTYAEYLERCGDDHLDAEAVVLKAKRERGAQAAPLASSGAVSGSAWEDQKRRRNRQRELPIRRDKVLAAIEAAEARKKEIHALYCAPGFFERTGKDELAALSAEEESLGPRIDALIAEWEEIEQEIAKLESG